MLTIDIWCASYRNNMAKKAAISYVCKMELPSGEIKKDEDAQPIKEDSSIRIESLCAIWALNIIKQEYKKIAQVNLHLKWYSHAEMALVKDKQGNWVMESEKHEDLVKKLRNVYSTYKNIRVIQESRKNKEFGYCYRLAKASVT